MAEVDRRHLAERPLWLFNSGPLDASACEWDTPPAKGATARLRHRQADLTHEMDTMPAPAVAGVD
ncbi:hypothetical protein [Streptomyces lydicus]|uniref:hypothetical protein n=1 Tax=Streptomyces lydicus TaxID=47763 RepID=UPI0035BE3C7C